MIADIVDSLPVAALTVKQFRRLLHEGYIAAQVEASRKVAAEIDRMTGNQAAKCIGKRRALITAACESGALPANRIGRNWSIAVRDLDAWASAGCPANRKGV